MTKLAHTGFKSEANSAHVLCFWKLVTEVKCSDQALNPDIHSNIHDSLYQCQNIKYILSVTGYVNKGIEKLHILRYTISNLV